MDLYKNKIMNNIENKKPYKVFETIDISSSSLEFQKFIDNFLNIVIPHNYEIKTNINLPFTFLRRTVIFKTHIGLCFNEKMNFLESLTHMDKNEIKISYNDSFAEKSKIWVATETESGKNPERIPYLHVTINTNELVPLYHQQLRFFFQLSGSFFFHIKYEHIKSFNLGGYSILQSLFINAIQYAKNVSLLKTELVIIVHDSNFEETKFLTSMRIRRMIRKVWDTSLSYLNLTKKDLGFNMNDLFLIWDIFRFCSKKYDIINFEKKIQGIKNFFKDTQVLGLEVNFATIEKMEFRKLLNIKNFEISIANAWFKGRHINFFPIQKEIVPLNFFSKVFCVNWFIENIFDTHIFLEITKTINKWYSLSEKGIYISDFGKTFKKIVKNIQIEKKTIIKLLKEASKDPKELSQGIFYTDREKKLIEKYINRIWVFLEIHTKKIWLLQIKMLQFKCSEIYKEKILKLLIGGSQKWELEKEKALIDTEKIFANTAKGHNIPLLKKNILPAKIELRKVLEEFTQNIRESPAAELQNLERIDREVQTMGLRTKSLVVGCGLTTAVRLRGYGNFQMLSSYAFGPHVFNFSCINDRDTLENETKHYIRPFRMQPSLNFDIRL
jgi:hypothetical protein